MKAARAKSDDGDGHHLSEAEMIAFCQERMAAAEREAARAHVLQCDECLQLFKDVNDFFEPRREGEIKIGELQVRRAWKEFWPLAQDIKKATEDVSEPPRATWRMATAAGLLLMLGLAAAFALREKEGKERAQRQIAQMQNEQSKLEARLGQIEGNAGDQLMQEREQRAQAEAHAQTLQTQLNELRQARQNVPTYSRMLVSEKGGRDDWRLSVPAKTFWLRLAISKPYEFPEYSIELLDRQGRGVAERRRLRPVDTGYLSFALSRSEAPTGHYNLLLYGHRGKSKRKKLGEYELSLSYSR